MNPKVFIADDNPADLDLIQLAFEECALQVDCFTAPDGLTAMDFLRTLRPDLILLDINMPGADGFEVLRWLRGESALRDVPVVVMSSSSANLDRQKARELGALTFWTKPSRFKEVVAFAGSLSSVLHRS